MEYKLDFIHKKSFERQVGDEGNEKGLSFYNNMERKIL